ncbi:hypothetical protein IVIADoCa7_51 [Xanthomonas phage vB_Xar_IVIA-DoCa7]|uniref:Tail fiber protein n=1 Tax=Xanthomonas phage vB_Xar_IVIA-DoCa7 TaxID=2975534 RepID=A0A9X9JN57_9CAUD|nr:hypothetical protein IVIADoCa7_51 [Xanthomonas phage vB_Xar_IVIA-DoCa7]
MHFRLFDRPLIVDDPLSTMYIDGQYDDYDPGSSYEGRVQIHNSVGFCKVEVLDSNIPPGAYVYVDNISKEVVLKWPVYTPPVETFTLLENGDFSAGDTGSWTNTGEGNPFVIEPDSSGNMSMKFKSGFSGGHFSRSPLAPVKNINRQITLTGQIAQGKSSKRKLWGGLLLAWFDENRNILSWNESNWINSGGDYKEAKVIAAPTNPLTKYVAAQIHFDRRGQNHPGWADNIQWDHVWEKGYDSDETLFVEVRVTDALNNTATHRGTIDERSIWRSSQLYPIVVVESIGMGANSTGIEHKPGVPGQLEVVTLGVGFTGIERRSLVAKFTAPVESVSYGAGFTSIQRQSIVAKFTAERESIQFGAGFKGFARQVHPSIRTAQEHISFSAAFTKITRTKL